MKTSNQSATKHPTDKFPEKIKKEIRVDAIFDDDSKRFHRFTIDKKSEEIQGSLYIPKGSTVPDVVVVRLRTKGDVSREKEKTP